MDKTTDRENAKESPKLQKELRKPKEKKTVEGRVEKSNKALGRDNN